LRSVSRLSEGAAGLVVVKSDLNGMSGVAT